MLSTHFDIFVQLWIVCTGLVAIYLTNTDGKYRNYACIIGLCGQPAWIYLGVVSEQYIMLVLYLAYTFLWAKGVYTFWGKTIANYWRKLRNV